MNWKDFSSGPIQTQTILPWDLIPWDLRQTQTILLWDLKQTQMNFSWDLKRTQTILPWDLKRTQMIFFWDLKQTQRIIQSLQILLQTVESTKFTFTIAFKTPKNLGIDSKTTKIRHQFTDLRKKQFQLSNPPKLRPNSCCLLLGFNSRSQHTFSVLLVNTSWTNSKEPNSISLKPKILFLFPFSPKPKRCLLPSLN